MGVLYNLEIPIRLKAIYLTKDKFKVILIFRDYQYLVFIVIVQLEQLFDYLFPVTMHDKAMIPMNTWGTIKFFLHVWKCANGVVEGLKPITSSYLLAHKGPLVDI